ncbi:MAG: PIN domain-containing protein [Ramlibacter sp.]|nr:PIN domain-containing protein [Ramlibacter sp.]
MLDYENVQPTEGDLRAMVPDASQLWVFHGPHQRHVEQRFASFGADVTAVPISKTGRNALDFHLSFYMGYIASRNQASPIVVVANDKGYGPMLEHAKAMGFAVRQQGHGHASSCTPVSETRAGTGKVAASLAAKKSAAEKGIAKKAGVKPSTTKQVPGKKPPTKKAVIRPATKKAATSEKPREKLGEKHAHRVHSVDGSPGSSLLTQPLSSSRPVSPLRAPTASFRKLVDNLWKMGKKRPVKSASLRRALKSFMGADTGDESIELALGQLIAEGVVVISARSDVEYPGFDARASDQSAKA